MFSPEGGPHVVYVGEPRGGGPGDLFLIDRYPPGGGLPKPFNLTSHRVDVFRWVCCAYLALGIAYYWLLRKRRDRFTAGWSPGKPA